MVVPNWPLPFPHQHHRDQQEVPLLETSFLSFLFLILTLILSTYLSLSLHEERSQVWNEKVSYSSRDVSHNFYEFIYSVSTGISIGHVITNESKIDIPCHFADIYTFHFNNEGITCIYKREKLVFNRGKKKEEGESYKWEEKRRVYAQEWMRERTDKRDEQWRLILHKEDSSLIKHDHERNPIWYGHYI